jgi:hypothetical protein
MVSTASLIVCLREYLMLQKREKEGLQLRNILICKTFVFDNT